MIELEETIRRTKFDRYQDVEQRLRFVSKFLEVSTPVTVTTHVHDCRDPRDNIFLCLALDGQADLILTGDADLLALHPWRNIPILTPSDFLARSTPLQP